MKHLRLPVLVLSVLALAGGFFFSPSTEAAPKCPNGPDYNYISRDYQACLTTMWICEPGTEQFLIEDCGCGCVAQ